MEIRLSGIWASSKDWQPHILLLPSCGLFNVLIKRYTSADCLVICGYGLCHNNNRGFRALALRMNVPLVITLIVAKGKIKYYRYEETRRTKLFGGE